MSKLTEALDLIECLVGCFIKRDGDIFSHKNADGTWEDVNEDLQDYLTQCHELLEEHGY